MRKLSSIRTVREISSIQNSDNIELAKIDDLLKHVEGKTISGTEREGSVFKAIDGSHSFKVINNQYLINQKD